MKNRLAYISEDSIKLKVLYRVSPEKQERIFVKWMNVVPIQDHVSKLDAQSEISHWQDNQVTAGEMLKDSEWNCLLTKWDCVLKSSN